MIFKEKWNDAWDGFQAGKWNKEVNLRDFIQLNYTPYDGDDSFLAGPTQNTKDLWAQVMDLTKQERAAGGVLDMDTKVVSTLTSQMIDTMIFITIAFGLGYGWIFTNIKMLGLMIIGQYLFKAIVAVIDTPFFYLMTRSHKEDN